MHGIRYVDIQVNGYMGVDFNDPSISIDDIAKAAQAMLDHGVETAYPTVITGHLDLMERCIKKIENAIRNSEVVARVFAGIHIEGPFLSPRPGYIGAHPKQHALDADTIALDRLLDAGGDKSKILTLAPEVDATGALTRRCVERGVLVAAGHTDASVSQIEACIDAGLSLFTHLGNGCPKMMDRHDNIIYRALRFSERLHYTLIADSFHVPEILFRNFLNWIPVERLIVVSDAISAAGLGPGAYKLGEREVRIGEDGACRDPSGEHFVGSASTLRQAAAWLESLGLAEHCPKLLRENAHAWLQS